MKICSLGGDGYLGWPTAMHFSARGHEVMVEDNMAKRSRKTEVGAAPLEPVPSILERPRHWRQQYILY
jgi:UDP-sulfoquinovose synthase